MNHCVFSFTLVLIVLLANPLLPKGTMNREASIIFEVDTSASSCAKKIMWVPSDYPTIQTAINNAGDGDVIFVKPGIYNEHVVVNKSVFLIGANQSMAIIDGGRKADVVTIATNNVVLNGFTIQNGGIFPSHYGVKILQNKSNNIVQHNTITGNFVGIIIEDASFNKVRWNNITKNRYGVFLARSHKNTLYANNVSENEWNGIELDWSNNNVIDANTISHNTAYGFEIPIETPSRSNLIYHNNFINNTLNACASGYLNVWDNGYPSGGNYWSDYTGVDVKSGPSQDQLGSDGLGGTPYVVDTKNRDLYPILNPFTPAPPTTPVADFMFSPRRPQVDETVTFNASGSVPNGEDITVYIWDFGDGVSMCSRDAITTHTYTSLGSYDVVLYVIDGEGLFGTEFSAILVAARSESIAPYVVTGTATMVLIVAVCVYFVKVKGSKKEIHQQKQTCTMIKENASIRPFRYFCA